MITKQQLKDSATAFRQVNAQYKLTKSAKSCLYQLIVDDYKSRNKSPVSRRRNNKKEYRPNYVAPAEYGLVDGRKIQVLWPCKMVKLNSSWIIAVGYNAKQRVLKLSTEHYTYAYQDVPESAYRAFITTASPGKYFSSFKKIYKGVAIV